MAFTLDELKALLTRIETITDFSKIDQKINPEEETAVGMLSKDLNQLYVIILEFEESRKEIKKQITDFLKGNFPGMPEFAEVFKEKEMLRWTMYSLKELYPNIDREFCKISGCGEIFSLADELERLISKKELLNEIFEESVKAELALDEEQYLGIGFDAKEGGILVITSELDEEECPTEEEISRAYKPRFMFKETRN